MDYNKHYIRLQGNTIVAAFSDAFQQPEKDDICVNEKGTRHFNLDLFTEDTYYKLKWDGEKIVEKTKDEIFTPDVLADIADKEAKEELKKIDLESIRAIREYILKQEDCPEILKNHETAAITERTKIKI